KDVRLANPGDYQVTSPPAVIGDVIVVGSAIGDNRGIELERGVVRGFDARTGKLLWNWDPIPRNIDDPARKTWANDSAARTGVAMATKVGHIFVLDRETGKPLFPVEERPVPGSRVPGEEASPTQPFPTLPLPLGLQKISADDAWGPTSEDCAWCREHMKALH